MAKAIGAGRVAVVTGAASGIGFALSERFCQEGMRVVMADVEEPALDEAADLLASRGAEVLPVPTDVARPEQMDRLRHRALEAFGGVHVLCNNAGVVRELLPVWEVSQSDWDWGARRQPVWRHQWHPFFRPDAAPAGCRTRRQHGVDGRAHPQRSRTLRRDQARCRRAVGGPVLRAPTAGRAGRGFRALS